MSIEFVKAQYLCRGSGPDVFEEWLALLEPMPLLSPTHWGIAAGIRDRYDRGAAVGGYRKHPDAAPCFLRTRAPGRYSGRCLASGSVTALELDSRGELDAAAVAGLLSALGEVAAGLKTLDFGSVDLLFAGAAPEHRMSALPSGHHPGDFQVNGPSTLFARNFFGARLVELAGGDDVFAHSGFDARKFPNGTIRLDLLPNPWERQPAELKHAQGLALAWLERTGLRARTRDGSAIGPGPRWVPPSG